MKQKSKPLKAQSMWDMSVTEVSQGADSPEHEPEDTVTQKNPLEERTESPIKDIHCSGKIRCRTFYSVAYLSYAVRVQEFTNIFRRKREITYKG